MCDLDYPAELYESHNDYPLGTERLNVTLEMLGQKQLKLRTEYNLLRSNLTTKLIPNLLPKKDYCCHYRNLRFYLQHGM